MQAKRFFRSSCAILMLLAGSSHHHLMASNSFESCSKELTTYFPEALVNETLKKFNVPEDKWAAIRKELAESDKNIVREVERKAAEMHPNPLQDPKQRQVAVKLFKDTLVKAFADALQKAGVGGDTQIQAMLEDLQLQKAKRFAACLGKLKSETPPANTPLNESVKQSDSHAPPQNRK